MTKEPIWVCLTGPDGAGKTTQIERVAARLEKRPMRVAIVTIWDLLLDPSTRGRVGFRSPREVDDYLAILHPTSRALFLYHCLQEALELARRKEPEIGLVNGYWYKYYTTEIAHGGDPDLLRELACFFPEPKQTFYLQVHPDSTAGRKAIFSRYESGFAENPDATSFLAFQERARPHLERLAREGQWTEISGSLPIDIVTDQIVEQIEAVGSEG